jgi:hypothetical protein
MSKAFLKTWSITRNWRSRRRLQFNSEQFSTALYISFHVDSLCPALQRMHFGGGHTKKEGKSDSPSTQMLADAFANLQRQAVLQRQHQGMLIRQINLRPLMQAFSAARRAFMLPQSWDCCEPKLTAPMLQMQKPLRAGRPHYLELVYYQPA